jgi:hypothetical protein
MNIRERRSRVPIAMRRAGVHGIGSYGAPTQRDLLRGVNLPDQTGKPSAMTGTGLFPDMDPKLPTGVGVEKTPRPVKKRFIRGAWYFTTEFGVPHTINEARNRKAGQLVFEEDLEIAPESLAPGKRVNRQVIDTKAEDATTLFGQFIRVLIEAEDKAGNKTVGTYYMSLEDRSGLAEKRLRKTGRAWRLTDVLRTIS